MELGKQCKPIQTDRLVFGHHHNVIKESIDGLARLRQGCQGCFVVACIELLLSHWLDCGNALGERLLSGLS